MSVLLPVTSFAQSYVTLSEWRDETKDGCIILKPVWPMGCEWDAERERKYLASYDTVRLAQKRLWYIKDMAMDAQTGEIFTAIDIPKDRYTLAPGTLLTWEDVK